MITANLIESKVSLNDQMIDTGFPEGWRSAVMRDLVSYKKGKKPKRLEEELWQGAIPYINIEAFETKNIRRFADPDSSVLVDEGDIVVVWDGARCGHVGKVPNQGALGSTLMTIKPIMIDSDYLLHFLQLSYETINSNPRGTGIPHVAPDIFWNLELPLAPLPEQKRIVAKVEELLARVDAVRECLARVKEILKRFRQSVLAAAFTGRLLVKHCEGLPNFDDSEQFISELWESRRMWSLEVSQGRGSGKAQKAEIKYSEVQQDDLDLLQDIPKHWQWISLSACTDVTDGTHDSPKYHETGIPLITSKNLTRTGLHFEKAKLISLEDHNQISKRSSVSDGDILFAMIGTIGHPTIINGGHPFSIKNVGLFRTFGNITLAKYLKYWLSSTFVENYFRETLKGSSQPFAPLNLLRRFPVPTPPRSELDRIVVRVEELLGVADLVEARIASAIEHAEELPQAIFAKAFRGELVPTEAELARQEGRSYEPASDLLAKIKAQEKEVKRKYNKSSLMI
jgi:type I restriction enzyme, S subunit